MLQADWDPNWGWGKWPGERRWYHDVNVRPFFAVMQGYFSWGEKEPTRSQLFRAYKTKHVLTAMIHCNMLCKIEPSVSLWASVTLFFPSYIHADVWALLAWPCMQASHFSRVKLGYAGRQYLHINWHNRGKKKKGRGLVYKLNTSRCG